MGNSPFPTAKFFVQADSPHGEVHCPTKIYWNIQADTDGCCIVTAQHREQPGLTARGKVALNGVLNKITLEGNLTNEDGSPLVVTINDLYGYIKSEYGVVSDAEATPLDRLPIALVISTKRCTYQAIARAVRIANRLSAMGHIVRAVVDDNHSEFSKLACVCTVIEDEHARCSALHEKIVFVNSAFDLPQMLQQHKQGRRVIHIAHTLEQFEVGATLEQCMAPKPFIELLYSLPVERIAVSEAIRQHFAYQYKQHCLLIRDAIAPSFFEIGMQKALTKAVSAGTTTKIVQRVFSNDEKNGVMGFIESIRYLAQLYFEKKHFHLTLLLDPGVENFFSIQPLPANFHLEVVSHYTQEDLLAEYRNATFYGDSSYNDCTGYAALEAMAAGLTVIKNDTPAFDGIAVDRQHYYQVPKGNKVACATAFGAEIAQTQGASYYQASQSLLASFAAESTAEEFVQVFSKVLGATNTTGEEIVKRIVQAEQHAYVPALSLHEHPRFSVLVPVYNHDAYLGEALDTLKGQGYPHWEAIVVNDGSLDRTPEVMERYAREDSRFKLYHKENGGTASALNAALENASHDWICWLSSDDFFKLNKLELHAEYIKLAPRYKFFHTRYSLYYEDKKEETFDRQSAYKYSNQIYVQALHFCWWNYVHGNTIAIHRSLFDKVGNFSRNYPSAQDFDMWFRMSLETPFYFIDEITCTTRLHAATGTSQFPQAGLFDSYRSLVDRLNDRPFEKLFPFVDFNSEIQVARVIRELISISLMPMSFIYQGVLQDRCLLLEKLHEWIDADPKNEKYRLVVAHSVQDFIQGRDASSLSQNTIDLVVPIISGPNTNFTYKPINSINEYLRTYEFGRLNHKPEVCNLVARYLFKLRKNGVAGLPDGDLPMIQMDGVEKRG